MMKDPENLDRKKCKKVTTLTLQQKKQQGHPITMLTAYDYPTALAVDSSGIDVILVGDSLGMVVLGYQNTLPVTMDEMLHHCKAVFRGVKCALMVGDMPFMSYQVSADEALRNAGRFIQEAGMDAVKLEGGRERIDAIRKIVDAGIPVMGHLGLTPQSVHKFGGFQSQGKTAAAAQRLYKDAFYLQDAGCFGLVLEAIPGKLASLISAKLEIPTIGIGAGVGCDGQVLVTHDILGLYDRFTPRFVKQYADLHAQIGLALEAYKSDVDDSAFPGTEHTFEMPPDEWEILLDQIDG